MIFAKLFKNLFHAQIKIKSHNIEQLTPHKEIFSLFTQQIAKLKWLISID